MAIVALVPYSCGCDAFNVCAYKYFHGLIHASFVGGTNRYDFSGYNKKASKCGLYKKARNQIRTGDPRLAKAMLMLLKSHPEPCNLGRFVTLVFEV